MYCRPTLVLPPLPDGWHVKERMEDRPYYWNPNLKISIWEHPASWKGKDEIEEQLAKLRDDTADEESPFPIEASSPSLIKITSNRLIHWPPFNVPFVVVA